MSHLLDCLFRRPIPRGIVFQEGKDQKFRWRCVAIPANLVYGASLPVDECRTVFTDTIQDGYMTVKPCLRDAAFEIKKWVHPSRVRWYYEHGGVLLECYVGFTGRGTNMSASIVLPEGLQDREG